MSGRVGSSIARPYLEEERALECDYVHLNVPECPCSHFDPHLFSCTQLEATGKFEVTEADLTEEELKEFQAALESGRLAEEQVVEIWKPWWTDPAAADLELGPHGQPLIEEGLHSFEGRG